MYLVLRNWFKGFGVTCLHMHCLTFVSDALPVRLSTCCLAQAAGSKVKSLGLEGSHVHTLIENSAGLIDAGVCFSLKGKEAFFNFVVV